VKRKSKNKGSEVLLNDTQGEFFKDLYFKYHGRLVLYANKYLHDIDLAKDIVQESFLALWGNNTKQVIVEHPKAYLFQSVRNKALNHIRSSKRELVGDDAVDEVLNYYELKSLSNNETPFKSLLEVELEEQYSLAKKKLPKGCLQVFEMSRSEGLKNIEIAERLGVSIKTVEKHISKALLIFRKELLPYLSLLFFV
jgi:RNA polymerase sigma-70 factor (ECF subfamily)